MMRTLLAALCLLFLAVPATGAAPAVNTDLPTVSLSIGGHRITAEVAATNAQRAVGLMNRFSLRPDHGMLFVFDRPEPQSFWMKNTYMPLSIAFIGSDGRILNIDDMTPQTEASHWSAGPALFALEMRHGWFAERGIRAGDRVEGLIQPRR